VTSRVDPILDLIDGALADPGQHSPESDQYTDVAPAMPPAGTCWRCTIHPATGSSDLCDGCRCYLLEDSQHDPANALVDWQAINREQWEAGNARIITADPQVSSDGTMSWTAVGPPVPQDLPPDRIWHGASLVGYVSDELHHWVDGHPSPPASEHGIDLNDIDFSAVSEAIGSFGTTMAEIAQRVIDVVSPVLDELTSLGVDLEPLRDMPSEVDSWDDLLTAARAIRRAAPHLSDRTPIRIGHLRALNVLRTMSTDEALRYRGIPPTVFGIPVLVDETLPPDAFQWRPQDPPSGPNPLTSMVTS
jgi:hypothetical protein